MKKLKKTLAVVLSIAMIFTMGSFFPQAKAIGEVSTLAEDYTLDVSIANPADESNTTTFTSGDTDNYTDTLANLAMAKSSSLTIKGTFKTVAGNTIEIKLKKGFVLRSLPGMTYTSDKAPLSNFDASKLDNRYKGKITNITYAPDNDTMTSGIFCGGGTYKIELSQNLDQLNLQCDVGPQPQYVKLSGLQIPYQDNVNALHTVSGDIIKVTQKANDTVKNDLALEKFTCKGENNHFATPMYIEINSDTERNQKKLRGDNVSFKMENYTGNYKSIGGAYPFKQLTFNLRFEKAVYTETDLGFTLDSSLSDLVEGTDYTVSKTSDSTYYYLKYTFISSEANKMVIAPVDAGVTVNGAKNIGKLGKVTAKIKDDAPFGQRESIWAYISDMQADDGSTSIVEGTDTNDKLINAHDNYNRLRLIIIGQSANLRLYASTQKASIKETLGYLQNPNGLSDFGYFSITNDKNQIISGSKLNVEFADTNGEVAGIKAMRLVVGKNDTEKMGEYTTNKHTETRTFTIPTNSSEDNLKEYQFVPDLENDEYITSITADLGSWKPGQYSIEEGYTMGVGPQIRIYGKVGKVGSANLHAKILTPKLDAQGNPMTDSEGKVIYETAQYVDGSGNAHNVEVITGIDITNDTDVSVDMPIYSSNSSTSLVAGGAYKEIYMYLIENYYRYRPNNITTIFGGYTFYFRQPKGFDIKTSSIKVTGSDFEGNAKTWKYSDTSDTTVERGTYTTSTGETVYYMTVPAAQGIYSKVTSTGKVIDKFGSQPRATCEIAAKIGTKAQRIDQADVMRVSLKDYVNGAIYNSWNKLKSDDWDILENEHVTNGSDAPMASMYTDATISVSAGSSLSTSMEGSNDGSTWFNYDGTDGTVIPYNTSMTGAKLKVNISNASKNAMSGGYQAIIPIPKKGKNTGLPDIQKGTDDFTWDMHIDGDITQQIKDSSTAAASSATDKSKYKVLYSLTDYDTDNSYLLDYASSDWKTAAEIEAMKADDADIWKKVTALQVRYDDDFPAGTDEGATLDTFVFSIGLPTGAEALDAAGGKNIWGIYVRGSDGGNVAYTASLPIAATISTKVIEGHVYTDDNRNGAYDDGTVTGIAPDSAKSGVIVNAVERSGEKKVLAIATTDANGFFRFAGLPNEDNVDIVVINPNKSQNKFIGTDGTTATDQSTKTYSDVAQGVPGDTFPTDKVLLQSKVTLRYTNQVDGGNDGVADYGTYGAFVGDKIVDSQKPTANPTKEGWIFKGWGYFKNSSDTSLTLWDFANDTVAGDTTFYPIWQQEAAKVTIKLDDQPWKTQPNTYSYVLHKITDGDNHTNDVALTQGNTEATKHIWKLLELDTDTHTLGQYAVYEVTYNTNAIPMVPVYTQVGDNTITINNSITGTTNVDYYTVNVKANNSDFGRVTGDGLPAVSEDGITKILRQGESIPVTATPNKGYVFKGWTADTTLDDSASATSLKAVTKKTNVVGTFVEEAAKVTINLDDKPYTDQADTYSYVLHKFDGSESPDTISHSSDIELNKDTTLTSENIWRLDTAPAGDYDIYEVVTDPQTSEKTYRKVGNLTVDENKTGKYTVDYYTLTIKPNDADMGTIKLDDEDPAATTSEISKIYLKGEIAKISAKEKDTTKYKFVNWTGEDKVENSKVLETKTKAITAKTTIVANFTALEEIIVNDPNTDKKVDGDKIISKEGNEQEVETPKPIEKPAPEPSGNGEKIETGDNRDVVPFTLVGLLALGGVVYLLRRKKKD